MFHQSQQITDFIKPVNRTSSGRYNVGSVTGQFYLSYGTLANHCVEVHSAKMNDTEDDGSKSISASKVQ